MTDQTAIPDDAHHSVPSGPTSFDERAATWDDDPAKVERANRFAALIGKTIALQPGTALLEVGAGTGLVASALAPAVGAITLTDPSTGMRSVMERKAATPGHPLEDATVDELDLAAPAAAHPPRRFGLIVAVLVLHHVADLGRALDVLSGLCSPGGHIAVADLDTEDGSFHGEEFDGHHGIDRHDLMTQLRARGWTEVVDHDAGSLVKNERDYSVFLVTGQRLA